MRLQNVSLLNNSPRKGRTALPRVIAYIVTARRHYRPSRKKFNRGFGMPINSINAGAVSRPSLTRA
jgi:hypothetical protein